MTDKQFYSIFSDALSNDGASREAFVSDWALSSIWDDDGQDIPEDRIAEIGDIWDVAHLTIYDIRQHTGLSQAKFAIRFCIPRRSVEDWESGTRHCPDYLRLLLAQAVGLYNDRRFCGSINYRHAD